MFECHIKIDVFIPSTGIRLFNPKNGSEIFLPQRIWNRYTEKVPIDVIALGAIITRSKTAPLGHENMSDSHNS